MFKLEAGSFGTLHSQLSHGLNWQGGDAYLALSGFSQNGFRQQNEQQTGRLNANLGLQSSENLSHRLYLSHIDTQAEIPGALSLRELNNDPRHANPLNGSRDYQRNLKVTRLGLKSAYQQDETQLQSTLYFTDRALDNPVTTYEFQDSQDGGLRLKWVQQTASSRFTGGVNTAFGTADETRYRNLNARPGARILTRQLGAFTGEAYAQVEQPLLAHLTGIAGFQSAYATRDVQQSFPTSAEVNQTYRGFSPRLGLLYTLPRNTRLFANLSRSFEPPSWSEVSAGNSPGFARLKAQRATTAEIGARGRLRGLHWQAAAYHGWLQNELANYRFPDGSTATTNVAHSLRDGVELGLHGTAAENLLQPYDALELRGAYTLSHFTLDDDPQFHDARLPGVAEHLLRAEALYKMPNGLRFGPNIEWSPRALPVDLTDSLQAKPYAIFGARALWQQPAYSLYLEARNLLNRRYSATTNVVPDAAGADGRYFYPGEGRALYAGLSLPF